MEQFLFCNGPTSHTSTISIRKCNWTWEATWFVVCFVCVSILNVPPRSLLAQPTNNSNCSEHVATKGHKGSFLSAHKEHRGSVSFLLCCKQTPETNWPSSINRNTYTIRKQIHGLRCCSLCLLSARRPFFSFSALWQQQRTCWSGKLWNCELRRFPDFGIGGILSLCGTSSAEPDFSAFFTGLLCRPIGSRKKPRPFVAR